jgi:hypothetical protein
MKSTFIKAALGGIVALLVGQSWQQAQDPLLEFCRRFGHQTTVMDDKYANPTNTTVLRLTVNRLFIDGGLINFNPLSQYPVNYSSRL